MDYEKYLISEKSNWSKGFDKVLKTIKSVKTEEQLKVAQKMIDQYMKAYSKEIDKDDPVVDKYTEPMRAVVQKRFAKAMDDARRRVRK